MRSIQDLTRHRDATDAFYLCAGVLFALLVLTLPAYFLWPGIFPGPMILLLSLTIVNIGAWTIYAGEDFLQPHQVVANIGMMVLLIGVIISLAVGVPLWLTAVMVVTAVGLAAVAIYRVPD